MTSSTPKRAAELAPVARRAKPDLAAAGPGNPRPALLPQEIPQDGGLSSPQQHDRERRSAAGKPSRPGVKTTSLANSPGPGRPSAPAGGTDTSTAPLAGTKTRAALTAPASLADLRAAAMSEDKGPDSLDAHVRKLMKDLGLWGYHPWRSDKSEKGWPDWTILGTRILYRELKSETADLRPDQKRVRDLILAAGGDWGLWRPSDLLSHRIHRELTAISGLRTGAA